LKNDLPKSKEDKKDITLKMEKSKEVKGKIKVEVFWRPLNEGETVAISKGRKHKYLHI
jgi:hypothetical protein